MNCLACATDVLYRIGDIVRNFDRCIYNSFVVCAILFAASFTTLVVAFFVLHTFSFFMNPSNQTALTVTRWPGIESAEV